MTEENAWVVRAQQGDDDAFTQLVETYQKPVYNLCYRMLGEPDTAEDAAQETFMRAYQNLHRYDSSRAFGTWILSIAAHYCIDRLRKKKFSVFSMDAEDDNPALMGISPEKSISKPARGTSRSAVRGATKLLYQK